MSGVGLTNKYFAIFSEINYTGSMHAPYWGAGGKYSAIISRRHIASDARNFELDALPKAVFVLSLKF